MYACIARPICQFSQIQRVQYVCPISPAIYISQLLTSHPNLLSHITNTHPPKTKTKKTKKKNTVTISLESTTHSSFAQSPELPKSSLVCSGYSLEPLAPMLEPGHEHPTEPQPPISREPQTTNSSLATLAMQVARPLITFTPSLKRDAPCTPWISHDLLYESTNSAQIRGRRRRKTHPRAPHHRQE